jgi:alanine dehydrogenase
MVLILSDSEVRRLVDIESLLPIVKDALVKQAEGAVERPDRPHFPVGIGLESEDPAGTAIAMPAYVHGEQYYATKLVSLHDNEDRDLPSLNAQIVLTNARTGVPLAFMDGTRITNARTGCIGGLATCALALEPVTLAVIGAGAQARWQTRAIAATTDVEQVLVYSPSDSRYACAEDLQDEGIPALTADSAANAVADANVIVTATTSETPVFPADILNPGTLVIAIGAYNTDMQELEPAVVERAARVFADVPAEVASIGDLSSTSLSAADLVPLADLFRGRIGRESEDEIVLVESVGTAVLDAAASTDVYRSAREADVGTEQSL